MKNKFTFLSIFLVFLSFSQKSFAFNSDDIDNMPLEDVFKSPVNPEVTVASKKELTLKKSPGIITLITDKEIENSGARTIQEVLELIPGITFNLDVEGVAGIGTRGLWAHEGKTLVLLDGLEMNDTFWSIFIFGNHIQTNQIKRIEVLRGPGSSIYGGYAELAVINIITKQAEDLKGFSSKITFGSMISNPINNYTKRNFELSFGQKFDDFSLVAHTVLGLGNTSEKTFTDFYNNSFSMANNQKDNPLYLNLGLQYKDLSARLIADTLKRTTVDLYNMTSPKDIGPMPMISDSYLGELKYDFKPSENLTITPKVDYRKYYPWVSNDPITKKLAENKDYAGVYFNKTSERYSANLLTNYDLNENFNFIGGLDYYYDLGKAEDKESETFGPDKNKSMVSYNNYSLFLQGLFKNDLLSVTLGSRVEDHSSYGLSFVPRASLASTLGDFHTKLLYSKAFRAPSITNINNFYNKFSKSNSVKPENTTVIELEMGYDLTDNLAFSVNGFDIGIQDPIIYFYDDKKGDAYDNFEKTGTRGIELELKYSDKKIGYTNLAYSYYIANDNKVDVYAVSLNKDALLAMPNHKFSLNSHFNITDNLSINPSFILFGSRYGYKSIEKDKTIIAQFDPTYMLNLNLLYKDLFTKGLNVSLSGFNLLNQTYYYIQAYDGTHAPLPGPSTEISLNIGYNLPIFNK